MNEDFAAKAALIENATAYSTYAQVALAIGKGITFAILDLANAIREAGK